MKKSVIFFLVTILVLMVALPGVTMARGNGNGNGRGNAYGHTESDGGASAKEIRALYKMVDKANKKIDKLIKRAQATPYNDIDWLLDEVEDTVRPVFNYGLSIGVTVVCELEEYYIDGQYVLVDPLRVVSI